MFITPEMLSALNTHTAISTLLLCLSSVVFITAFVWSFSNIDNKKVQQRNIVMMIIGVILFAGWVSSESRHAYAYKLVYNRAVELNVNLSAEDFNIYINNMIKLTH